LVSQGTCPPIKKIKTTQPVIMSNPGQIFCYDSGKLHGLGQTDVSGRAHRGKAEIFLSCCIRRHDQRDTNRTAKVTDNYI